MRFYLSCPKQNILDTTPGYTALSLWMQERGVERWKGIPRDLNREGGPIYIDTADEEDAVAFKLKFGHLVIPEPPYHRVYLESRSKMAKIKRIYMGSVRYVLSMFFILYQRMR